MDFLYLMKYVCNALAFHRRRADVERTYSHILTNWIMILWANMAKFKWETDVHKMRMIRRRPFFIPLMMITRMAKGNEKEEGENAKTIIMLSSHSFYIYKMNTDE